MRRIHLLAILALLEACQTSDLTLPLPPTKQPPGTIYGTVVYAVPGQSAPQPAVGASITILGTALSTLSGPNGNFLLSGVTQSTGQLLFRFDASGNGMVDHQLLIELSSIGAGLGRQIDVGDVEVVQNATMTGKCLLGNIATSTSGHGGTTVFVPSGPFTTYTNDDGSYELDNLPAGSITIQYFHTGYQAYELDDVMLTAGEQYSAATIVLTQDTAPPPAGTITGKITFVPQPASVTSTVVAAVNPSGQAIGGAVESDGSFTIPSVPAGVYNVTVALTGYTTDVIDNVLLTAGQTVVLPAITLNAGNGVTNCTPGDVCTPPTVCHTGLVDCSTGSAVCKDNGPAMNGAICGSDEVCNGGSCVSCTDGMICTPPEAPCHNGSVDCSTGTAVCMDTMTNQPDGTSCGTDEVCNTGTCVACTEGESCVPTGNPCHTGSTDCSTGSPVCHDTMNILPNGSGCGTENLPDGGSEGQVCNGGVCVACATGVCIPTSNPCHNGAFSCNTGLQICVDMETPAPDGQGCGMNEVCNSGSCISCTQNAPCVPTNECVTGTTDCTTGTPTCIATSSPAPEGTSCGTNLVCHDTKCVPTGFVVDSGANQDGGFVDQQVSPVIFTLNDQNGAPLAQTTVTITPPSGGGAIPSTVTTASDGTGSFVPLLPLKPGTYSYTIASTGQGQILVPETATAPPANSIFTIVNSSGISANPATGVPGPGVVARISDPEDFAIASDGSIYLAAYGNNQIMLLSPTGELSVIAGTGTCGYTGDGAAPTAAEICEPVGIALDETNGYLYYSDWYYNVIRRIDLNNSIITTIAGGNASAVSPQYGDGETALNALFSEVGNLAIGPDGALYVSDAGHGRIRRIDPVTLLVTAYITPDNLTGAGCPASGVSLSYCNSNSDSACQVAWDSSGNLYVTGYVWGPDSGSCSSTPGIVRRNTDGSWTHVAGSYTGSPADGVGATQAVFPYPPFMAFDGTGNLYLSFPDQGYNGNAGTNVIRRVDAGSGLITTVAGSSGVAGFQGAYTSATQATLSNPMMLAVDSSQNLIFVDYENQALRIISAAANAPAIPVTLTKGNGDATVVNGGDGQTVPVDQVAPTFLSVILAEQSSGTPLPGYLVRWAVSPTTPGASVAVNAVPTDSTGTSSVQVRVGREPGNYQFTASFTDLAGNAVSGSPVTFNLTASAQPKGTLYTLVNVNHTAANSSTTGVGTVTEIGDPWGVVVAQADGTVYFSDPQYARVRALSPAGVLSVVAGNGSGGFSGDNGPAVSAQLNNPNGLALDETNHILYIADNDNGAVRAVNLTATPPTISTIAGRGTAVAPTYGDGGPATNAVFNNITQLSLHGGSLYVSDYGWNNIRVIDLTTQQISTWMASKTNCSSAPVNFYACNGNTGACSIAWTSAGDAFISGEFLDSISNCNGAYGVVRWNHVTGALTRVAGAPSGQATATTYGEAATDYSFSDSPALALSSSGNLFLSFLNNDVIDQVDGTSGVLTNVVGNGNTSDTAGSSGFGADNSVAAGAQVNVTVDMGFDPAGNLIFADYDNDAVRTVALAGTTTSGGAVLTKVSGDQSGIISDLAAAPLEVQLKDGSGNPLAGQTIAWTASDPGAYLYQSTSVTSSSGVASTTVRLGFDVTTMTNPAQTVTASYTGLLGANVTGSPVTFSLTANAPAAGTIFSVVDATATHAGSPPVSGPASVLPMGYAQASVVASDGSVYIASYQPHSIWKLSPQGALTLMAGTGGQGYSGDNGPALDAEFYDIAGLALDAAEQNLYLADEGNNLVRVINLSTGIVTTVAGYGATSAPNFGDGGAAFNANLSSPTNVFFGPAEDGTSNTYLYISDSGHYRIRYIDANGNIQTYLTGNVATSIGASTTTIPVALYRCDTFSTSPIGCTILWDADGNQYIAGELMGTQVQGTCGNGNTAYGVYEIPSGSTTGMLITGLCNGSTAEGVAATTAKFGSVPGIALSGTNLYLTVANDQRIRVVNLAADPPTISTIAGTETAGFTGDYGPATAAEFRYPWSPVVLPGGHLFFGDNQNFAFRVIW